MVRGISLTALILTLYLAASTTYNVFLHPLRHFPGPPLAKVSILWKLIGNLQGRKAHRIHEAHQQYGPVVRVAPKELSFSSPAAVRDIYASNTSVQIMPALMLHSG